MLILRPGLNFAFADGRTILLDVEQDRYFCLSEPLDRSLARALSQTAPDAADQQNLDRLVKRKILVEGGPVQREALTAPQPRTSVLDICESTASSPLLTLEASCRLAFAKWLHRCLTLSDFLERVRRTEILQDTAYDAAGLKRIAFAFRRVSLLSRTRDFCLPFSICLAVYLRRRGFPARLVLGVAGRPFAAHCWVQVDDIVASDMLDHVACFTPILVI